MPSSKQPAPPDPKLTAAEQLKLNKKTSAYEAKQNRFDQYNPFGNIAWKNLGTEENPRWTQSTALSKPQQGIYNTQLGIQGGAGTAAKAMLPGVSRTLATPGFDPSKDYLSVSKSLARLPQADLATRKHVEQGLMGRLNPSLQQDEEALRTRLANQGIQYGGEAYGNAMRDYNQRVNDARLAVIGQGGQEMERSQGMNLDRLQAIASLAGERQASSAKSRNQRLAELASMIQTSGSINLPTYGGTQNVGGIGSPDIASLISQNYQGQVAGNNARTAGNNAALAAALQAAGTYAGAKYGGR